MFKAELPDFTAMAMTPLLYFSPAGGRTEDHLERDGHGRRREAAASQVEAELPRGRQDGAGPHERAGRDDVHADQGLGCAAPGRSIMGTFAAMDRGEISPWI